MRQTISVLLGCGVEKLCQGAGGVFDGQLHQSVSLGFGQLHRVWLLDGGSRGIMYNTCRL